MAVHAEKLRLLSQPFRPDEIEWRVARMGDGARGPWVHVLAYQTSRAVMDRFDAVCGPESWTNEFRAGPGGGVICRIAVHVEGAGWVAKEDGAENTDIEAVKGGLSGAMKRAAVQWGVGRYLYGLEEAFGLVHEFGGYTARKGNARFRWNPPALPDHAIPEGEPTHAEILSYLEEHARAGAGRVRLAGRSVDAARFLAEHADLLRRDFYLARQLATRLSAATGAPLAAAAPRVVDRAA